jgi:hypothetical protein
MPSQDAKRAPTERATAPAEPDRRMSRRSMLRGAATAGAAGLAATAIGAAAASPALAATSRPSSQDRGQDLSAAQTHAGPIVVHVRDAKSGDIEVFSGTSQTRLRDKDLAARIARAIG